MIISLSGLIGSGKDTVAEMLVNDHGFKRDSFARTLKDAVSVIFGWDREMLEGKTKEAREQREQIDIWWSARLGIPELSPRWVLQHYGTEIMRTHFHTDIWVASLENNLLKNPAENIVISDARFVNELNMLKSLEAEMICVARGDKPTWWNIAEKAHTDTIAMAYMVNSKIHRSEWDWADYKFDDIIYNNGSLEDLKDTVNDIV